MNYESLVETIKRDDMVHLLNHWCSINSGSTHLAGLKEMAHTLRICFEPIADCIESKPLQSLSLMGLNGQEITQQYGDCLMIRKRPQVKQRVLLCGHMDTVYDCGNAFQKNRPLDANRINGPGVADMKGGLVVMLYALSLFEQSDCASQLGWDVLINSEEELGSPGSCTILKQIAAQYQAALVYEPSLNQDGLFAKSRKGSLKLSLKVTGKKAHAGRDFEKGKNAICYLASIITAIHSLNGQRLGLTINVGQISGGEALNVVPDNAVAKLDIRFESHVDERWFFSKLDNILHDLQTEGYFVCVQKQGNRPVKNISPQTAKLFDLLKTIGHQLNIPIDWQNSGGCCDGNNLASYGLPVIDNLGVRGGHLHTPEEYVIVDSLPERAILNALFLMALAQGGLRELHS